MVANASKLSLNRIDVELSVEASGKVSSSSSSTASTLHLAASKLPDTHGEDDQCIDTVSMIRDINN